MPAPPPDADRKRAAKRIGGRLCLDFVNTVSAWEPVPSAGVGRYSGAGEQLDDYAALLDWSSEALPRGLRGRLARLALGRPRAAARVHARSLALRDALYRLFRAQKERRRAPLPDLARLETEWRGARERERLTPRLERWTIAAETEAEGHAAGEEPLLALPLHAVVRSAVELLTSPQLGRVRACPGEHCGWLFLDTSRAGRRRWCDMDDCGNLEKVRRFRARRSARRA